MDRRCSAVRGTVSHRRPRKATRSYQQNINIVDNDLISPLFYFECVYIRNYQHGINSCSQHPKPKRLSPPCHSPALPLFPSLPATILPLPLRPTPPPSRRKRRRQKYPNSSRPHGARLRGLAVRRQLLKTRKASTRLPPTPDHYKTAMGYKALAHRFRLAIDLPEPFTLEDVLDALSESIESIEAKEKAEREARRKKVKNSEESAAAGAAAEGVIGASEQTRVGVAMGAAGALREGAVTGTAPETLREGVVASPHPCQPPAVEKACGEAGKILEMLRKQNRKKGRPMGRSMGALDEILHGELKLLHVPRSA